MSMDAVGDLRAALAAVLGGPGAAADRVAGLDRMMGGASRETWSFTFDGRPLVLRRDPPGIPRGGAMEREAALLRAAAAAGVPVAEVVAASDDPAALGAPYVVMSRLEGETLARRILRDERFAPARAVLVGQCGQALARLHRGVATGAVPDLPELDPVAQTRETLDGAGEAHPAFELGFRWLAENLPDDPAAGGRYTVVHGDFRLGNLMVGPEGLRGVLDWEIAHLGDPAEDLGWMCVRSWRFGGRQPVAGVGTYDDLLNSYREAGGLPVNGATLHWWEVFGTLRWGVICMQQARTHLSGAVRSVELNAIGRRVCEVELDLLDLLPGPRDVPGPPAATGLPAGPHDRPTAAETVEAVREFLEGEVSDAVQGRTKFLARVAARALGQVERELALGPALAAEHAARLAGLGFADDAQLAAAIRAGAVEPEKVTPAVRAAVVAKLHVADPKQLTGR